MKILDVPVESEETSGSFAAKVTDAIVTGGLSGKKLKFLDDTQDPHQVLAEIQCIVHDNNCLYKRL